MSIQSRIFQYYQRRLAIQNKIKSVIKRMRWKAIFSQMEENAKVITKTPLDLDQDIIRQKA